MACVELSIRRNIKYIYLYNDVSVLMLKIIIIFMFSHCRCYCCVKKKTQKIGQRTEFIEALRVIFFFTSFVFFALSYFILNTVAFLHLKKNKNKIKYDIDHEFTTHTIRLVTKHIATWC